MPDWLSSALEWMPFTLLVGWGGYHVLRDTEGVRRLVASLGAAVAAFVIVVAAVSLV